MNLAIRQLGASVRMFVLLTVLLGLVYPAVVLGLGQVVAPGAAEGSLARRSGTVVGSSLIGQQLPGPQWFQPRPSATGYGGATSGATNLAASDARLTKSWADTKAALLKANPYAVGAPPADAYTASASGLDPHISVAYALWQVPRVARARHLSTQRVEDLVQTHTQGRTLGFLGEPRVNVLELNLALDSLDPPGSLR
ncbi:MAG TPA: potassium-transporting ATPase subunit KdpC [Pedococcus sp.]|jgi:K+-transporting ATPase ATPase C chain|nr:potassium-transporting ATPase subunit KdpC [Pedococcus sp.]